VQERSDWQNLLQVLVIVGTLLALQWSPSLHVACRRYIGAAAHKVSDATVFVMFDLT
jgi:hypothetical protein